MTMLTAYTLEADGHDLYRNRRGLLSNRQAKAIRHAVALWLGRAAAICVPGFIILALLFDTPDLTGVLLALALSGGPFIATALWFAPHIRDANAMHVEIIRGPVRKLAGDAPLWLRMLRLGRRYDLVIQGARCRVSHSTYLAVEEGIHTVYVLPTVRWVVNIEP